MEKRETWSSRATFILAAIGSAVGLGNAWRFPGLAAKHGGGAFLLVYVIAMLALGIPMLMMEIAMGRRIRQGTPGSMRAICKKSEPVGWMAVSNAFFICIYYGIVFAWVIMMFVSSYRFAGMTGDNEAAGTLWLTLTKTTGTTAGYDTIPTLLLLCAIAAWGACYYCIRNGTSSVGKVVNYTVSLPIICLVILAVRGFTMEGAMAGLSKLFIPDWSALTDSSLWLDAIGQVFYSLSVAMAIMIAYGSFLKDDSNIAVDGIIIAVSDLAISVLAGIVMFTTMAGTGMLDQMTASGISTAFIVYPRAIVNLTNIGWLNSVFAYVFYFCLITLAIDSHFSIVEGVSTALSDKFHLNKKKTTFTLCIICGAAGLLLVTGAGLAWVDIIDYFINNFTLILAGILEAFVVGWIFKPGKVLDEINRNTVNFKMPAWWFKFSIKIVAPIILSAMLIWNIVSLLLSGGIYGAESGYSVASNAIGGWLLMAVIIFSGFIIKAAVKKTGTVEDDRTWDDFGSDNK